MRRKQWCGGVGFRRMTLVSESGDLDFNLVARPGRLISFDIFPPQQSEGAGHRGDLWAGNQTEKKLSMAHGGQKWMESFALPHSNSIRSGVKISGNTEVVRNYTTTQTHHQRPVSTRGSEQGSRTISRAAPTLPSPKWMNELSSQGPYNGPKPKLPFETHSLAPRCSISWQFSLSTSPTGSLRHRRAELWKRKPNYSHHN